MTHHQDYLDGKITLEEYRRAQGLKLASEYGYGGQKARRKSRKKYVAYELQIQEVKR